MLRSVRMRGPDFMQITNINPFLNVTAGCALLRHAPVRCARCIASRQVAPKDRHGIDNVRLHISTSILDPTSP